MTCLNCYPAHERAANSHCTKVITKDHITDHISIITSLHSSILSSPSRSTKWQQFPRTHLKALCISGIKPSLTKCFLIGHSLGNWPVGHCRDASGQHELFAVHTHRLELQGEKRSYRLQKQHAENQGETSALELSTNSSIILEVQAYHTVS